MKNEDPSSEDIERFSHDTAHCPDCGAEVWDSAEVCPKCFAYLDGHTSSRSPTGEWFRRRWVLLLIVLLIVAMLFGWWL